MSIACLCFGVQWKGERFRFLPVCCGSKTTVPLFVLTGNWACTSCKPPLVSSQRAQSASCWRTLHSHQSFTLFPPEENPSHVHSEYVLSSVAMLQGQIQTNLHTPVNQTANVDTLFIHQWMDSSPMVYDAKQHRKEVLIEQHYRCSMAY